MGSGVRLFDVCARGFWRVLGIVDLSLLGRPGGDLLSHALRRSTIGAEGFHGRVRDGIGWDTLAMATRSSQQRLGPGLLLGLIVGVYRVFACVRCACVYVSEFVLGLSIRMAGSQAYRVIRTG